jgi:hypothetical protein
VRRWVVERTHSGMNRFRRILVRRKKRADTCPAMLRLALGIITWRATGLLRSLLLTIYPVFNGKDAPGNKAKCLVVGDEGRLDCDCVSGNHHVEYAGRDARKSPYAVAVSPSHGNTWNGTIPAGSRNVSHALRENNIPSLADLRVFGDP